MKRLSGLRQLLLVSFFIFSPAAHAGFFSDLIHSPNSDSAHEGQSKMSNNGDAFNLDFTCVHEADHLPPLDPYADNIFKYARYLEKKEGEKDYTEIGNYYRRAARLGHYKAMGNLQVLLYQGLVDSPAPKKEAVSLVEQLIKMNIPFGYYIMGTYLEEGYGVKPDRDAALAYFRKAADLGNPDGQTAIGNILHFKLYRFPLSHQFWECAADQGHAEAASQLAIDYKFGSNRPEPENRYPPDYVKAAKYSQKAVESGHTNTAFFMSQSFAKDTTSADRYLYIGFGKADPERSRRYNLISKEIDKNPSARFPDIDKIVPLPPSPLPHWDGTFAYRKELDKQKLPEVPPPESEDIKHMPPGMATVPEQKPAPKPAPVKPVSVVPLTPLGTLCATGQVCPETGYWEAVPPKEGLHGQASYFTKGDAMPTKQFILPRKFAWMDDVFQLRKDEFSVNWKLVSYPNTSQS